MSNICKLSDRFRERVNSNPDTISRVCAKAEELYSMSRQKAVDEVMRMLVSGTFDKEETEIFEFDICLQELCKVRRQKKDGFDVPTGTEKWFIVPGFKTLFLLINTEYEYANFDAYLIFTSIRDYLNSSHNSIAKATYVMEGISKKLYSWSCEEGEKYSKAQKSFHGILCEIFKQDKAKVEYVTEMLCNVIEGHRFEKAFADVFLYLKEHIEEFPILTDTAEETTSENVVPHNEEAPVVIEQPAQAQTQASKLTPYQLAVSYREINTLLNSLDALEVVMQAVEVAKTELSNAGIDPDAVIADKEKVLAFVKAVTEYQDE